MDKKNAVHSKLLSLQSLILEKDLTIGMFAVRESLFLIINYEIRYPGMYPYIFQISCRSEKPQNTVST